MLDVGPGHRRLEGGLGGERLGVPGGDLRATLPHQVGTAELGEPERGGEVRQVGLVAGRDDFVAPRGPAPAPPPHVAVDPVQRQHPASLGHGGVGRGDHAALPGGERLRRVEREAGHRGLGGADRAPPVGGREGVRGVLDHRQAVAPGCPAR